MGKVVACLEIRLLGAFEALRNGAAIGEFESNTERALLAYLACEPGRGYSRAMVAEMLWPDRPQGAALGNLRHALSDLRRSLGDTTSERIFLMADRTTVGIRDSAQVQIDLVEFERLAATAPGEAGAVEKWRRAADLWRGPLLDGLNARSGVEWDEWVLVTGERLRRHLVTVLRHLADHHQRSGEPSGALATARRLIEVNPWDERDHRRLLRLLATMGGRAEALVHYETLVERFGEKLGVAPTRDTAVLVEQIRTG